MNTAPEIIYETPEAETKQAYKAWEEAFKRINSKLEKREKVDQTMIKNKLFRAFPESYHRNDSIREKLEGLIFQIELNLETDATKKRVLMEFIEPCEYYEASPQELN